MNRVAFIGLNLALTQSASTEEATMGSDDKVVLALSTDYGTSWLPIKVCDATTPISNTGDFF
jgi:hypothetical protein